MVEEQTNRIRVKPLEWAEPSRKTNFCWTADCVFGVYSVVNEDGWHAVLDYVPHNQGFEWSARDMSQYTLGSAQRECEADYERRVLSALAAAPSSSPRPLEEWHEDHGDVVWWTWRDGQWLGEPAYIGSPLDLGRTYPVVIGDVEMQVTLGGWPGYHTHWTPHPAFPPSPSPTRGAL